MYEIIIEKYNETFLRLYADEVILEAISNYFVFKPDNYQFHPKYRSGVWDGKVRFYNQIKNLFPQGLLFRLYVFLKMKDVKITFKNFDKADIVVNEEQINKYADYINFPHKLRDYQLQYIQTGLKERKCVLCSPTATGKSAIIYFLHRMFLEKYKDDKVLIIVPTLSLVEQMAGDFVDYSDESYFDKCQLIYGGKTKESYSFVIKIETVDGRIYRFEQDEFVKLIDGSYKKADQINEEDEIDDAWLLKQSR